MIDKITEQKIKDAANIVDVVGEFVTLKKRGANYEGICPFHADRTPGSFKVSQAKNICSCWACSNTGLDPIAFLQKKEGMSYPDALRWLAGRYDIACDGADEYDGITYEKRQPAPPKPILEIPAAWVRPTLQGTDDNTLMKWIKSLPWNEEEKERIKGISQLYLFGYWKKEGHAMFWQCDVNCKVRTGKMMLYKPDGHRDKDTPHNFDWIHSWLGRDFDIVDGRKVSRKPYYDKEAFDYQTWYFGSHLIDGCKNATVNIVESEKTALICAIAYGDTTRNLWIATGGKEFLKPWSPTIQALIQRKRKVALFPDKDATEEWKKLAKDIGYSNMVVNTEFMERYWRPCDGEKADIADIIVRLLRERKKYTLDELKEEFPAMNILIDKLDLTDEPTSE